MGGLRERKYRLPKGKGKGRARNLAITAYRKSWSGKGIDTNRVQAGRPDVMKAKGFEAGENGSRYTHRACLLSGKTTAVAEDDMTVITRRAGQ